MPTPGQIQEVARHFIIAAIWADCPEGTHPRATLKAQAAAFDICKAFINANLALYEAAMNQASEGYGSHPDAGSAEAAFGHDLWLTLNGHGCGFWDRGELEIEIPHPARLGMLTSLGDALSQACRESPFRDPIGSGRAYFYRGWLYIEKP